MPSEASPPAWRKTAVVPALKLLTAGAKASAAPIEEETILRPHDAAAEVTLVVYEWAHVEPGTIGWVFPTQSAAMSAARALRNAVRWAIIRGRLSVEEQSERGAWVGRIVVEQSE